MYSMRGSFHAVGGGGTTSRTLTFFAPRSMSISTSRAPTKPVPPVTAHVAGTESYFFADVFIWSGDKCGEREESRVGEDGR